MPRRSRHPGAGRVKGSAPLPTAEFRRIARAFGWSRDPSLVGDDAAVLADGTVLCCDALTESVHFRFDWSRPTDVGWKAVAANVADCLAMGARPESAVWSVGMGRDWEEKIFAGLAKGALEACRAFGVKLVGGDTVRTAATGFVSLAMTGRLVSKPWPRSGARPGDLLVLLGTTGPSAAGLCAFRKGGRGHNALRKAHQRPQPPLELWERSLRLGVHAAIDISDGLSSETHHLSVQSRVKIVLERPALAPSPELEEAAGKLGESAWDWVLHGGEDHALLLSVPARAAWNLPLGARVIGRVEDGKGVVLEDPSGRRRRLAAQGWAHG